MLCGGNPFPLRERLRAIHPFAPRLGRQELLSRTRRQDAQGRDYYLLDGWKLYIRPDLPIRDEARFRKCAEQILREAYLGREPEVGSVEIRQGDTVMDLGGNIGTSALSFSRATGPTGRVFTFEPLTHSVLRQNLEVNHVHHVEVIPAAVGEAVGELDLEWTDSLIDSSIVRSPDSGFEDHAAAPEPLRTIRVPVTTVDAFVKERGIQRLDVIKMDIEGAEELALRGAVDTIRTLRPKWRISSYHTGIDGRPQHPRLVEILHQHGLKIEEVQGRHIYAW